MYSKFIFSGVARKLALFLLFLPAIAVLMYEAGIVAINGGLILALIYLGKRLVTPFIPAIVKLLSNLKSLRS